MTTEVLTENRYLTFDTKRKVVYGLLDQNKECKQTMIKTPLKQEVQNLMLVSELYSWSGEVGNIINYTLMQIRLFWLRIYSNANARNCNTWDRARWGRRNLFLCVPLGTRHVTCVISFSPYITCSSNSKEPACNAGDQGSIPGLGNSSGEGNGNPLQYSCLQNSRDRKVWWATVHGVAKSWTQLND